MNVTTHETTASRLEQAEESLQWLLVTTEHAVQRLATSFQTMAGRIDSILSAASSIVSEVKDETICSVREGMEGLGEAAKALVEQRMRAIDGILQTVTAEDDLLRQLSLVTDGQAKIALTIKALTVHTKIEIGHLGDVGLGFDYLAHELEDFSKSLAASTEKLTGQTDTRCAETSRARSVLSTELPRLYEKMAGMEIHLREDLETLNAGLSQLASVPSQFSASAASIARDIASVVVAFQAQDITRQQIEHVKESLRALASVSFSSTETLNASGESAQGYAGILIQIFQLRAIEATIAFWTSQIRRCMESVFAISGTDLAAIGPLVLEQERTMTTQLADIEQIEQASMICGGSVAKTLSGITGLSELVTEELKTSEFARNRLRMLTFNSVIEASSLGARADTICVIADGISEVSTDWTRIAQYSGDVLQEILGLSDKADAGIKTFTANADEQFERAREAATQSLRQLRRIALATAAESETISPLTAAMHTESRVISDTCDLLDTCFTRIRETERELDGLRREIELSHPGIEQSFDAEQAEQRFSAAYTTQSERDVLRAALYGTAIASSQAGLMGNDVELF